MAFFMLRSVPSWSLGVILTTLASGLMTQAIAAQGKPDPLQALNASIVGVVSQAVDGARSVATLGKTRLGSGAVIDREGHILTIGYLVIESERVDIRLQDGKTYPARVVAYDHATGLALLKSILPLSIEPITIGDSRGLKRDDLLITLPFSGFGPGLPTQLVSRRSFTGPWEYLLESPLYTFPPHPAWAGAPLLDENGALVGVGSLFLQDAKGDQSVPGNMFVPIEILTPILEQLKQGGRPVGQLRPWLGVSTDDGSGYVAVIRISQGGPAEIAGILPGDFILAVNGRPVRSVAEFYRAVWALGPAGISVPLTLERSGKSVAVTVQSIDRVDSFARPLGF
jgi:S1-C subfamily serine protease